MHRVTWAKKSTIWIQFYVRILGRLQLSNPSDLPCFFLPNFQNYAFLGSAFVESKIKLHRNLISTMGFPILVRCLYIEWGPSLGVIIYPSHDPITFSGLIFPLIAWLTICPFLPSRNMGDVWITNLRRGRLRFDGVLIFKYWKFAWNFIGYFE